MSIKFNCFNNESFNLWFCFLPSISCKESSKSKLSSLHFEQYLGVESVWSPKNYWVNMQICYDGLKGISFALGDSVKWEFVLLDNTLPNGRKTNEGENASEVIAELMIEREIQSFEFWY